jgi:hypothetical protein
MREFLYMTRKRSVHLLGACVLLGGGIGVPVLLGAEGAQAVVCGTAITAGTGGCTLTGSADLGAGALTLTSPATLSWTGTATGVDYAVVDGTDADETYAVNDARGSTAGWAVTVTATTFTTATIPALTLPDSGALLNDGSTATVALGGETDTVAPTAVCATGTTCTLPGNTTVFPVHISTAAGTLAAPLTTYTIYNAPAAAAAFGPVPAVTASGLGSIVIGGSTAANPVGWWLNVPANTLAGSYSSDITMAIVTAP